MRNMHLFLYNVYCHPERTNRHSEQRGKDLILARLLDHREGIFIKEEKTLL